VIAQLNYDVATALFTATLGNDTLAQQDPIELAKLLVKTGLGAGDVRWNVWTLQNKFEDIMSAVIKGDETWARMASFELFARMR
jgi:hypothetical protein